MTRQNLRYVSVALSVQAYRVLLFLYPSGFRREFGPQMLQVFRTACRRSRLDGSPGLASLWLRALVDLVTSAGAERYSARQHNGPGYRFVYLGALVLSLFTGYLHLRADVDELSIVLLLGGAFVCGVACPRAAWRWALVLGLGIPFALLAAHGLNATSFPHRDTDVPLLAPLMPSLLGAYIGAGFAHLFTRLRLVPLSNRE